MLQAIRDKTSGWIAYLIVFLISIPFALWGVNSYLGGGEAAPAATVNGQEISVQDLDNAYANYRRRLAQAFGGTIPEGFSNEALMKDQVLSQLIEEFALRSYAENNRYRIGDEKLNELIRSMEVFQTEGKFDPDIYQRQIASLGYSTPGFEFELRQTQAMEQLQSGITATTFTVPTMAQKQVELSTQIRSIRYLTRKLDSDKYVVGDDEVTQHFDSNQSRYMTEEQVKIDFIELSLDGIKAAIDVNEDQISGRYQQSQQSYTSTEVRSASHILLTVASDASQETDQQVEAQIRELKTQIDAGADFAELAKSNSQDPISAAEGGDLGEVERGMMVQPFEKALFELSEGEVTDPIKTSFGWHLIKLHKATGGQVRELDDELRQELENEIKSELAESQIYDLTENLANLAYEQEDSLLPAAEQLGLVLQTSNWFGRFQGEGIASEAKVRNAAFSAEILARGLNSEAIELADNRVVFIHLNEHKPAVAKPLEEVREQIVDELKLKKARQQNEAEGKKALDSMVSNSRSMERVADEWNSEIVDPEPIARNNNSEVDAELVKVAFRMNKPGADSAIYEGFAHANGDYTLIELSAVESGDSNLVDDKVKTLTTAISGQEYQSVLKLLGGEAEVVRTPANELDY